MKPAAKVGIVVGGYVLALLIAMAVVAAYDYMASADAKASSGMFAFGESLLFLAVFGVAAVPATAGALFFLRPFPFFWRALSSTALVVAVTGLTAFVVYLAARSASDGSLLHTWSPLAVLRILVAPLFALAFLVAALVSPRRSFRVALLAATGVEAVVFGGVAIMWILQSGG